MNKALQVTTPSSTPSDKGRKRLREVDDSTGIPSPKRTRATFEDFSPTQSNFERTQLGSKAFNYPVESWLAEKPWSKEYFQPTTMNHLQPRPKTPSLKRRSSNSESVTASSQTPSDQKPREEKSQPYQSNRYEILLQTKGSFMKKSKQGITEKSKEMCRDLLHEEQCVPGHSLFNNDTFEEACRKLQGKNEARVVQDIARLIVPSAENFATLGAEELEILVESVNEGWNNSVPLTATRPQPDYAVGFNREAFTKDRLERLAPFIGDFLFGDQSYFMATYYMYFPFFTSEVKCGAAALDIADRQNAHSMTLAVRAIVELFRLVKCEKDVDREILAFSVSHDHQSVKIFGHYAVIEGPDTAFYRHPIRTFSLTDLDGEDKWTAYKFTKSVYSSWAPMHFKRICQAIDKIPLGINWSVQPLAQDSALPQQMEFQHPLAFVPDSVQSCVDDVPSAIGVATPETSLSQQDTPKRQRKRATK